MSEEDYSIKTLMQQIADTDEERAQGIVARSLDISVSALAVYVVSRVSEHEECDDHDVKAEMRNYIKDMKARFATALDEAVEINLRVNGLSISESHNKKVADEILREMGND